MCGMHMSADLGSRPNTVRVDAPRWPIVVPASALPATRARRWAHIGLRGGMGSVGGGLAPLDPTRHRPGQPPVYEATSDGHAGWVPTKAQRPNRPLCGLPVITQAAVWGCWVGETWPRGPAVLVHCGWGQWRPLCTSHQPMRAKGGYYAAVGIPGPWKSPKLLRRPPASPRWLRPGWGDT